MSPAENKIDRVTFPTAWDPKSHRGWKRKYCMHL